MKATVVLMALALGAFGCSARYTILTVPAVSMTNSSFDHAGTAGSKVESKFCQGDDPIVSKDSNVGLIDEAVMKAQKESGATYLTDVTISRDGSCMIVEATAMK